MRRLLSTLALAFAAACAPAAAAVHGAKPPGYVPGEVVVQRSGQAEPSVVAVPRGMTVREAVRDLDAAPGVRYAVPNHLARFAGFIPDDPGRGGRANWQRIQWNFLAPAGVNAPDAWGNLIAAGRPGGRGATVAILDTGVAYRTTRRFRRSPDFVGTRFAPGYDFVDRDRFPDDQNGHGTFVAGVVAERVNNDRALTGIAYGATIMPVRVLDDQGLGDAAAIAKGIRYAARTGANVINLSLEFDSSVPGSQIPEVLSAIRYAQRKNVLVVAASGNEALRIVAYPARATGVMSVGATTEHLCQAEYSNDGRGLDIVAPGGGADAAIDDDPTHCRPDGRPGRDVFQLTFQGSVRRFGLPGGYQGTSMATPHVSAIAALVIASGVIGPRPTPRAIEDRLESTARDLGDPGIDQRYGAGLVDAARATAPPPPVPVPVPSAST
ncbi:MAG: serine protease [Solirubrobacteraceae bacterium]|jgi:serine protease|nr:serine protease [Solirubrobacteraceae bacterium]